MTPEHSPSVGVKRLAGDEAGDEDVLRRAREGDFRALYDAQFGFVLRTCLRLGVPDGDAEDAVQETFLVASRNLDRFTDGRLSTWIYRIARNVALGRVRRMRVRDALFSLWRPREEGHAPAPDELFRGREQARRVREVVARLSPKKREVFALYELEGLSGEEIAERVGCPLPTVWTRLHHARRDFERIARKRGLAGEEP